MHTVTIPFYESHPLPEALIGVDSKEPHRSGEQTFEAATWQTCHLAYVGIIQQEHRAYGITLVAICIMVNRLFFSGVALCVIMTTSASTLTMLASVSSIQQEGNAIADIARAIPKLTTLSGMDELIYCMCIFHVSLLTFYFYDASSTVM